MTGTFKFCSKAERSFHTVGSSGSLGICRVRRLRAQRRARTGHSAVRWVHRCPGPALGSSLLWVTGPFEKLRTALHLWPDEPHTARLPPLPSVGPNRKLSFLVHFPSLCCGGGKDWRRDASGFAFYARRIQSGAWSPAHRDRSGWDLSTALPIVHGPVLPRRWGQGVGPEGVFKPMVSEWRSPHPKEGAFQWLVNSSLSEFCRLMGQNCLSD